MIDDVSCSYNVITHQVDTMYRLNKTIPKMPQDHVEILTTNMVRDLAASGIINIEDLSNRLYNGKTKTPEIFSVSDMIANFKYFGLVPVQHPDLGYCRKYGFKVIEQTDDNNSARNKKNMSPDNRSSNTKSSQLMERLKDLRIKIKKLSAAAAVEHNVATQIMEDIGGEEVIVNVLADSIVDGMKNIHSGTPAVYTPVNYYETYDYFKTVNENRRAYFQAMNCIGDMLVADKLDGDKEGWQQHTNRANEEYRAWREKCNQSNATFKKTGHIMEYNDTKARRFSITPKKWIHSFCPCQ